MLDYLRKLVLREFAADGAEPPRKPPHKGGGGDDGDDGSDGFGNSGKKYGKDFRRATIVSYLVHGSDRKELGRKTYFRRPNEGGYTFGDRIYDEVHNDTRHDHLIPGVTPDEDNTYASHPTDMHNDFRAMHDEKHPAWSGPMYEHPHVLGDRLMTDPASPFIQHFIIYHKPQV